VKQYYFLEYAGVDPEMDTSLLAPTLASWPIRKQNYFIICVSVDPEMNIALEEPKLTTHSLEETKLVFKIYLSGSGNEQYIRWTEIGFITLSEAILFF